jgi:hypothetical protein
MLQSSSSFRALAKNRTNSPSPSSRQGRLFPPSSRISVVYSLGPFSDQLNSVLSIPPCDCKVVRAWSRVAYPVPLPCDRSLERSRKTTPMHRNYPGCRRGIASVPTRALTMMDVPAVLAFGRGKGTERASIT